MWSQTTKVIKKKQIYRNISEMGWKINENRQSENYNIHWLTTQQTIIKSPKILGKYWNKEKFPQNYPLHNAEEYSQEFYTQQIWTAIIYYSTAFIPSINLEIIEILQVINLQNICNRFAGRLMNEAN